MPTDTAASLSQRPSTRLGILATPEQEALLKRAAEIRHKALEEFILDVACNAAEQTLLDQRLFMVNGGQYEALLDLLDQPPQDNPGLRELFAKPAPWENP